MNYFQDLQICFNSNMVRLKDLLADELLEEWIGFNSNMVRLKATNVFQDSLLSLCFNSNMVRLKEVENAKGEIEWDVSIPIWCD